MPPREIPTLHVEPSPNGFVVLATSYGRVAPSGLGSFATEALATAAMLKLQSHLDTQRGKKEPNKAALRKRGDT